MKEQNLGQLREKVASLRGEGKYKETIEQCHILLECGMRVKDYKAVLTAYNHLAASYYCVGDIETALEHAVSHQEICDQYGDEYEKLNSYNILFLLHEYNKDIVKAKKSLDKGIALGKKLKKYNIVSGGYSNYSHIYMFLENYTKALECAKLGVEVARKHEPYTPILELRVKLNMAKAYIGLGNFEISKALIDEMMNDPILDEFIREKSQCYDLQGHWYSKQNLHKAAFEAFTYAKDLVETYHDVYLLKAIQEERCKLCELMGEFILGYEVQKEYIALLKEISDREIRVTALKHEIKRNMNQIQKKAYTDYLTGVFNRDYLEKTTNECLEQSVQKQGNIICIVFDIDNFKRINDEYGHLFGDEVIKKVSKTCLNTLKEGDLMGRYGGDEFVIILNEQSLEEGNRQAEQMLQAVRNLRIPKENQFIQVTISVGIVESKACCAKTFYELFEAADTELYKAKDNGKNQISIMQR